MIQRPPDYEESVSNSSKFSDSSDKIFNRAEPSQRDRELELPVVNKHNSSGKKRRSSIGALGGRFSHERKTGGSNNSDQKNDSVIRRTSRALVDNMVRMLSWDKTSFESGGLSKGNRPSGVSRRQSRNTKQPGLDTIYAEIEEREESSSTSSQKSSSS